MERRGGLGVAGARNEDGRGAGGVVMRMLGAAPHRGAEHRVVETRQGAVGVSGDPGVQGVCGADDWALAFAGVIDDVVGASFDRTFDGDATAQFLLDQIRTAGVQSAARRMRGTYAVVVSTPHEMLYWRDHFGFASLFHRTGGGAWVATEAKQVVTGAGLRREPDLDAVAAVFLGATSDSTPSALAGVDRVARKTYVSATHDGATARRYWEPESLLETSRMTIDEYREEFSLRMDDAVRRMMRGPDAMSLSGGVDSPIVASYAAPAHLEEYGTPLAAVSNVYPDHPSVDERPLIEAVADAFGMPTNMMVPAARPTDDMATWVDLFDGPYPVVSVSESTEFYRWARSLGFSVVLTGELAEFLTEMSANALGHHLLTGRWADLAVAVRRERARGLSYSSIGRRVLRSSIPVAWVKSLRRLKRGPRLRRRPPWMSEAPVVDASPSEMRTRWEADQLSFMGGSGILLEAHDTVTALARVDVRRPFADVDLWESTLRLRADVKHADLSRKALLRHFARGRVPDVILDRRDKTVFDASLLANIDYPELSRWLAGPKHRLEWIDYELLNQRIENRSIDLLEFMWMKDLAAVHAFLDQW